MIIYPDSHYTTSYHGGILITILRRGEHCSPCLKDCPIEFECNNMRLMFYKGMRDKIIVNRYEHLFGESSLFGGLL